MYVEINNIKYIIEIKPKSLIKDKQNKAKFKAAEVYCKEHDMKFIIWTEKELFD